MSAPVQAAEGEARPIAEAPLARPIRVVVFCGPVLERGMVRFVTLLERHPEVEVVGCFCQTPGLGWRHRVADLVRRRGVLALPVAALGVARAVARAIRAPRAELRHGRRVRAWRARLTAVPDIHAAEVLRAVRDADPDLGAIYGGPILKPELFRIPRLGTLGIHHGRLPEYRGKKTTFWALHHGEASAGVTIQRVDEGIDTGEIVRAAEVPVLGRGHGAVWREVEETGLDLYLNAVVAVRRGTARAGPPRGTKGPAYRDPGAGDLLRYALGRVFRTRGAPAAAGTGVLVLTESYHPMVGGGESQARSLAGELERQGRAVTVVTRRWDPDGPAYARVDGHRVVRVGPTGPGHLKKWGLVCTTVPTLVRHRGSHPTLAVCGFRVMGIPAALIGPALGMRVILKADSPGEMSGAFFGPGLARFGTSADAGPFRALLRLRNRILRRAHRFVAISSPLARELEDAGVPTDRIERIPNGVDLGRFRPAEPDERAELRRERGLPERARIAVYTGRLVTYKGLPLLVDTWTRLAERHPGWRLLIVGSGSADIHDCEDRLRTTVLERELSDRILFTGAVEDPAPWLRAADAFVFPSRTEAFGLSVVEAMACGLPVVSTRAGGLADVVVESAGAVPIPVDDAGALEHALERVLGDPDGRERRGRAARAAAVERYGIEAVGRAWAAVVDGEPGRESPR